MHEISVKSGGGPLVRRRSDHVFFVGSAIAIFATAVLAFSFALEKTDLSSQLAASSWVKIHMVAFSSWILLFFTQTVLVASRRTDLHRRLGVAGACLAAVMIGVTIYITFEAIQQGNAVLKMPPFEAFIFYTVPHVDIILFTIMVTAALLMRGQPEIHKRLMLLTTVTLLDAVADRLPIVWRAGRGAHFVVQDMFVVAGIANDLVSRGRISPAYIWGGLLILVCPPGAVLLYQHFIPAEWGMMLNFKP